MGLPSLTLRSDSFVIVMRHLGPEGEDWRPEAPALCDVYEPRESASEVAMMGSKGTSYAEDHAAPDGDGGMRPREADAATHGHIVGPRRGSGRRAPGSRAGPPPTRVADGRPAQSGARQW